MMKKYIYLYLPLLWLTGTCSVIAQSTDKNYVTETVYSNPDEPLPLNEAQSTKNFITRIYYDGLGRPIQEVKRNASPDDHKNIITHIEYNKHTGQTKSFLPFVREDKDIEELPLGGGTLTTYRSGFTEEALQLTHQLYAQPEYDYTGNPYREEIREASPRKRVLEAGAPGEDWKTGGHSIRYAYGLNQSGEVKRFDVTTAWDSHERVYVNHISPNGTHEAHSLKKTVTKNENWTPQDGWNHTTEEFTDHRGNVVLKRAYDGEPYDTYYVYDVRGNLVFVIPPLAEGEVGQDILDQLCYQYRYDERYRLAEKKLPAKEWEYIIYDRADRIVVTGPVYDPFGNGSKGWLFSKYDADDRVVMTGFIYGNDTTGEIKNRFKLDIEAQEIINERKISGTQNVAGVQVAYTNNVFPTGSFDLLTVHYYDDYDFPGAAVTNLDDVMESVKGMPTGSWSRVITSQQELPANTSSVFYNQRYQTVLSVKNNYLGGYTKTQDQLSYLGQPTQRITTHLRQQGAAEITIGEEFTYDHQGRIQTHLHRINEQPEEMIATHHYDALGRLLAKEVGHIPFYPLQKVEYKYNIRNWLTEINDVSAYYEHQLYSQRIYYNTGKQIQYGAPGTVNTPLYNGNISYSEIRKNTDNVLKGYNYQYDRINRLLAADFYEGDLLNSAISSGAFAEHLQYDKNGNIRQIYRASAAVDGQPIEIDDIKMEYDGNLLVSATDYTQNPEGFHDGNPEEEDYIYDETGNLISDRNKGILQIRYNHLNLPTLIQRDNGDHIQYIYDAGGVRMAKRIQANNGYHTDYLDGFQYKNGGLQFFFHPEGYVNCENNSYLYVYQYKDHLGNIRLSYADLNGDGYIKPEENEIIDSTDYYPFGLMHKTYETVYSEYANEQAEKYKFGSKEWQDELDLNMYDFGARNYMPDLGRWTTIDPLAEEFVSTTPYNYALNNPVSNIDPDGRFTLTGQAAQDFVAQLQSELDKPTPKEAAMIAKHVYGDKKDPGYLIGGWKVSSVGKGLELSNEESGFKSGVYERTTNGVTEYVYATAGTDDWQDVKHDGLQPLGMSSQYKESLENVKNLKDLIGNAELTFTGHSLGGGLAENNSLHTGDKAITFNAAGVSPLTSGTGRKSNTDAYIMTTDPLNAVQRSTILPAAGGNRHYLQPRSASGVYNGHSINSVIEALSKPTIGQQLNNGLRRSLGIP